MAYHHGIFQVLLCTQFDVDVLSFLGLNPSVTVRVGVKVPSSWFSLIMFCGRSDQRITVASICGFDAL